VATALVPLALLAGCAALGFVFAFVAQLLSDMPDPTYAYPLAMRIALGLGVWGMTLLVSRMVNIHGAVTSAWLWMAGLAILAAATLPGLSPYFLFPSLVAAVLLLVAAFMPRKWDGAVGQIALLLAALAALLAWFPLVVSGETIMGLKLHPLFTISAAFGLMTLVPLIAARPRARMNWFSCEVFLLGAALAACVCAGLLPAYSATSPQRINLQYLENGTKPARWIAATAWKATGTTTIPASLMKVGRFKFEENAYGALGLGSAYSVAAGKTRYPLPTATVERNLMTGNMRVVTIRFRGSADTDALFFRIPQDAKLAAIGLRDQHLTVPRQTAGGLLVNCASRDCRDLVVTLTLGSRSRIDLPFAEVRYAFPEAGAFLKAARPASAMPSQSGDLITLADTLHLPAR
jgi:hypothetical protein